MELNQYIKETKYKLCMQVHIYLDKLLLTYLHKFLFNKDLKKKNGNYPNQFL